MPKPRKIPEFTYHAEFWFWEHIKRAGPDECWEWTGAKADGYGRYKGMGRVYGAHRVAYALRYGSFEPMRGRQVVQVMHSCDNPGCCNPNHLSLGTAADNARDMVAKRRSHIQNKHRNRTDLSTKPGRKWLQAKTKADDVEQNQEVDGSPSRVRTCDNSINSQVPASVKSNRD